MRVHVLNTGTELLLGNVLNTHLTFIAREIFALGLRVDAQATIPDGDAIKLAIPILASAMDGVTDVKFCIEMGKLGGLGVINLEGVQTRYEDPGEVLENITKADTKEVTELIQKAYLEPIKPKLITRRIQELKKAGVLAAVSSIPQKAEEFGRIAQEAGATVTMPAQDMFWGDRYGVVTDPYGHKWSFATHIKDMTPDQMQAAMKDAFVQHK